MNLLRAAQRTVSLSMQGVREAVLAVAERVAVRVHLTKLQLQADDAEARLQLAYEALGQCLYDSRRVRSGDSMAADAALPLSINIRHEQQLLQELRDRLASHYDEVLTVPLAQLQQDLKEGGGTVERVTISPGAQADGKLVSELGVPDAVRLVAVRRDQTILIASGSLRLQAGDELTVLGRRSALPQALQILRT
jgi:hypothetical protein